MSGITKILTRTPSELGSIKTNKSPIVEENKQLPAEQWNTAADAIIEIQTVIGEAANPAAGTITEVLSDHEERIDELEQNGGGGGTPDRIESASGDAFVETTDDFFGMGNPGSVVRTVHSDGSAMAYTAVVPGDGGPESQVLLASVAVANADDTQVAGIRAQYDPTADEFALWATGAPLTVEEPTGSRHAATKGYVDARPGADAWSEHPATQDVDLDGNKLTGLGEPTDASDAATKQYVDAALDEYEPPAPTRMEWAYNGVSGKAAIEALANGSIHLWKAQYGSISDAGARAEIRFPPSISGASNPLVLRNIASGGSPQTASLTLDVDPFKAWRLEYSGGSPSSPSNRGYLEMRQGIVRVSARDGDPVPLMDADHLTLPTDVDSFMHGIHLAKESHDQRTLVEWWDPVWTPVMNVDSVSNVECSYTRTYRAAGGSLVTLEGTIEVTQGAAGQCAVQVDLPTARVGSGLLVGPAVAREVTPPGHVVAVATVDNGKLLLRFNAEGADPYLVGFRASYRAA